MSRVSHTYAAAIQHDLFEPPAAAELVGVVRRPTGWFSATVDRNLPALGPPADLLDEAKQLTEDFKMQGLCDEGAHNAAWDDVDFDERYRDHLATDPDAAAALDDLETTVREGSPVVLVCFENTEKKRCHRTILADVLDARLDGDDPLRQE